MAVRSTQLSRLPPKSWQALAGARVFVTGGTGWLGRNLLELLILANREYRLDLRVTALSRHPEMFIADAPELASAPELTLLAGDVRHVSFPDAAYTHIVHGAATRAAETFAGAEDVEKFLLLVDGTRRVLELARRSGTRNFLMLSSGAAAVPPPDGSPWHEDHDAAPLTTTPNTGLGQGKRAAEYLVAAQARSFGISATIARCFSFVGPHLPLDLHYAAGNFIADALARRPIRVKGDGTALRSYLYTEDLAIWLVALLARQGEARVYNVGSDQAVSILQLAEQVRDVLAPTLPVVVESARPPTHAMGDRYVPDIQRARRELGLDVWTPLDTAIRLTADFFDAQPSAGHAPSVPPHQ